MGLDRCGHEEETHTKDDVQDNEGVGAMTTFTAALHLPLRDYTRRRAWRMGRGWDCARGRDRARLAVVAHARRCAGPKPPRLASSGAVSIGLLLVAEDALTVPGGPLPARPALYQLAVFVAHLVFIAWLGAGFLSFGGELPGIGDWRIFDTLREPWLTILQVTWGLSVLVALVLRRHCPELAAIGAWRGAGPSLLVPVGQWGHSALGRAPSLHPEAPAPDMPAEEVSPEGPAV